MATVDAWNDPARRARESSEVSLPSQASLDERQLASVRHVVDGLGAVEAFVPARQTERNANPHAPALVFVPGLGMDGQSWMRQLPLTSICDFHAVRPPANGAPGESGLGHFARYYEAYIEAAGLDRRPGGVVLVGSSMGGAISLLMAQRQRVKLRGLVLAGTYGCCSHLGRVQRYGWPLAWLLPEFVVRHVAKPMLKNSDTFGRFTDEEAAFLLRCITVPSRGYYARAARALTRLDLVRSAHEVKEPTLVLHGVEDRVLPLKAGRELAEAIPGARLASFENSGHAFFFTHHEAFNAAVAAFLIELRAIRPQTQAAPVVRSRIA